MDFSHESFIAGYIHRRLTRFSVEAEINGKKMAAYLQNPGRLTTVLTGDLPKEALFREAKMSRGRRTVFDLFAIKLGDFYVTVNSTFANTIFKECVKRRALKEFAGYHILREESKLHGYGRIDFLLSDSSGRELYVEVKSCTEVVGGVAKFPDAVTRRGRKHMEFLGEFVKKGNKAHVVFIVQRPDAHSFMPFVEVDPKFSRALKIAVEKGLKVSAYKTQFVPPYLYLCNNPLPVILP